MKKLTFKGKTAILITLLVTALCAVCLVAVVIMSHYVAEFDLQQQLIKAVERNADEIDYKNGVLDIENDFAFFSNDVYCSVYGSKYNLISSQAPVSLTLAKDFNNGVTSKCDIDGQKYYTYDTLLTFCKYEYEIDIFTGEILNFEADTLTEPTVLTADLTKPELNVGIGAKAAAEKALNNAAANKNDAKVILAEIIKSGEQSVFRIEIAVNTPIVDSIWVRGIISADNTTLAFTVISKVIIYIFPLIVLLAGIGAYIIAKHTIKPIENISASAKEISSGNDLTKRIIIGDGNDEIHVLAKTFNNMLTRLQASFENEKQFTSVASHELRTPLAVIKAECDYILSVDASKEDINETFLSINEQTDKMTELVSVLLMLSRTESGRQRFNFEKNDLSILCDVICSDFVSTKGISLESDIESGIEMEIEPLLISRLIENLLSNAEKYGKENGNIFVKLYKTKDSIVLSVRDNGIGIAPDELSHIFSRFYRSSAVNSGGGFGIGLAVVKKIAELHNGTVYVESVLGSGSVFTVTFLTQDI